MRNLLIAATLSALAAAPAAAVTFPITGGLDANWYTVTAGGAGDFQTYCCTDRRADMVLSTLGPNGLPVYNLSSVGPQTLKGIDAVTNEIQWWTPGVTAGGDTVTFTGTTSVSAPFNDPTMFPTNGAGSRNGGSFGFQTAHFESILFLSQRTLVTVTMSADDDAWFFIDDKLVTGLGGVHANSASPVKGVWLNAGSYAVDLFYADRHTTDAKLSFSLTGSTVPEPATWAMLIAGFGLVGYAARRRKAAHAA